MYYEDVDTICSEVENVERSIRPSGEYTSSISTSRTHHLLFACECIAGLYCTVMLESYVSVPCLWVVSQGDMYDRRLSK